MQQPHWLEYLTCRCNTVWPPASNASQPSAAPVIKLPILEQPCRQRYGQSQADSSDVVRQQLRPAWQRYTPGLQGVPDDLRTAAPTTVPATMLKQMVA